MYIFYAEMKHMVLVQPTNTMKLGATPFIVYKIVIPYWDWLCDFRLSSHNYSIPNIDQ